MDGRYQPMPYFYGPPTISATTSTSPVVIKATYVLPPPGWRGRLVRWLCR